MVETVEGYSQNVSAFGGRTRPHFRLLQNRRKVDYVYLGLEFLICRFVGHVAIILMEIHFQPYVIILLRSCIRAFQKTLKRSLDNRYNYKISLNLMKLTSTFINAPFHFNHGHGFHKGWPCK